MPFELPSERAAARRNRVSGWLSFAFAATLVALLAYLAYVGYEGSRQLTGHPNPSADCRTPAAFGWPYEAVNYDVAADARLDAQPDPLACLTRGAPAGDALVTEDGVRLAGWYLPAATGIPPNGPTVVLAHGWGGNKSTMLDHAAVLREQFNVVAFDFRNHGQSGGDLTTQGALEQADLRAVVDWIATTKGAEQIAVLGVSMGGATAVSAAGGDERVDALIIDSTHAALGNAIRARLERAGYPLSLPGSWAVLLGSLIRTGQDISAYDPIAAVTRLGERPLLVLAAGGDVAIGPTDPQDLAEAAAAAGVPTELHVCEEAGHGGTLDGCPVEYRDWVLGFLQRSLGQGA